MGRNNGVIKGELKMNSAKRIKESTGIISLALFIFLLLAPASVLASEHSGAARLSRVMDETYVLAQGDVEWSYAEPNLTLEKGDLLQTNETGMAEIQFGSAVIFRVGESSRVAVIETDGEKVIGMESGRAYIRAARDISRHEYFTLTFPSGQLLASEKTLARIDILENGNAELRVIRGEIELEPMSEAAGTVEAGERVLISPDGMTEYGPLEVASMDEFDKWNEERDIALSKYRRPEYIDEDIVGAEDLDDYGEWVYVKRYRTYAWHPHVVEVWRPYYHGRWYYSGCHGWIWISEEPWGYATHHYGSWDYDPHYGWIWMPGRSWRPARVHWVVYEDYVGWVPIGYRGHPVITRYPYYVTGIYLDFFDTFSFTFVYRHHFHVYHHHHRHHRRHHRDRDRHRDIRDGDRHRYDYKASFPTARRGGSRGGAGGTFQVDVIDHTVEPGRIKKGRVRFVKDIERLDVKKDLHKGKLARRKIDYTGILDIDNHPKLRKKIDILDKRQRRFEKRRVTSIPDGPPKRVTADKVKTLDFRERVRNHAKVFTGRDKRVRNTVKREDRRNVKVNDPKTRKERIVLERPVRRTPIGHTKERERTKDNRRVDRRRSDRADRWNISNIKKRDEKTSVGRKRVNPITVPPKQTERDEKRVVDRPQPRKVDRWDVSNVRKRDEKSAVIRERRTQRTSPPRQIERRQHKTRSRVLEDSRQIERKAAAPRPNLRNEANRSDIPDKFTGRTNQEMRKQEVPRRVPNRKMDEHDDYRGENLTRGQGVFRGKDKTSKAGRSSSRSFGRNR